VAKRKLSAVRAAFEADIQRLSKLDADNQRRFTASIGAAGLVGLPKKQLQLLTEATFFAGFRSYENFLRDAFLLYCLGQSTTTGKKVRSYLQPRDVEHAEELLQSSMPFLDWSSPSTVSTRAEVYLKNGFPVKNALTSNQVKLQRYKVIRNHIAHKSTTSLAEYKKVLKSHFSTIPLVIPEPGEFLLLPESGTTKYKLQVFFDDLISTSQLVS
jgi:hypothetical protein